MNRKLIAIVPAAGVGSRAATAQPKQYQLINGVPMLHHAVLALLCSNRINQVRVAVAPNDSLIGTSLDGMPRTVWRACGGPTRAHTVALAIADAKKNGGLLDSDWVLVHDAARPGLPKQALERLIDACLESDTGGLLALPIADTVKKANSSCAKLARVKGSVPRSNLWAAQTPQMFNAGLLEKALQLCLHNGVNITDESSAIEYTGYKPILVTGAMRNFKVTWPEDFDLISKLLA